MSLQQQSDTNMSYATLYSKLDIEEIYKLMRENGEQNPRMVFQTLAHLADIAERYDDMCVFMREVVLLCRDQKDLSNQERNLFSIAFKNAVGQRRHAWRGVEAIEGAKNPKDFFYVVRLSIEKEIEPFCMNVLELLEKYLIPHQQCTPDSKIFYQKMAGDYFRYLAEIRTEDKEVRERSAFFYQAAMETAQRNLAPTDPVRLGLALNYSVCLFEIMNKRNEACDLARTAYDQAIYELHHISNNDNLYRDCTLILNLLRDNLSLWMPDCYVQEL